MAEMTLIEAVRETMREEMRRDADIFLLGEDIGPRGGVFLATEGFIEEFGEERVINTPLAESSIIGIALGAAVNDMRPIAEISVCRLRMAGHQSTRGRSGASAIWHQWTKNRPDDRSSAVRRWSSRWALSLSEH